MVAAVVEALLADADVQAIVGDRVYVRQGVLGGLAAEAFGPEGDLVGPSLVVVAESRVRHSDDRGSDRTIRAEQTLAVYAYDADDRGYARIKAAHAAVRRVLHRRPLDPIDEPVSWLDTRWSSYGPELIEEPRNLPVVVARYTATITDPL